MRLAYHSTAAEGFKAFLAVNTYIASSGLDPALIHMVYLRVSQINGCSYCIDLHWKDAVKEKVDPRRLNGLVAWRHMPFFSAQEKAAFAWAEAVTLLEHAEVPQPLFDALKEQFNDKEITDLTFAVAHMNALNRIAIAFEKHA